MILQNGGGKARFLRFGCDFARFGFAQRPRNNFPYGVTFISNRFGFPSVGKYFLVAERSQSAVVFNVASNPNLHNYRIWGCPKSISERKFRKLAQIHAREIFCL